MSQSQLWIFTCSIHYPLFDRNRVKRLPIYGYCLIRSAKLYLCLGRFRSLDFNYFVHRDSDYLRKLQVLDRGEYLREKSEENTEYRITFTIVKRFSIHINACSVMRPASHFIL